MKQCIFCKEIASIKKGTNDYFVAELETGYVLMSWFQYFKGYTMFVLKNHVTELHELEVHTKNKFLCEMSLVAEAVLRAFKPKKLNYAMLGNLDPHIHWHLIPRYGTDPSPQAAIWKIPKEIRMAESERPTKEALIDLKNRLNKELETLIEKDRV